MTPPNKPPPRPGSHPRLVVTETVEHSRRVDGPLPRPAFFPPAEPPTPAVRMPGPQEPPPAPQRGPRKETAAGGFVVPRREHQAPQGEAFTEDEQATAPAVPHPLSEPPAQPAARPARAREDSRDVSIDGLEARLAEHVKTEDALRAKLAAAEDAQLEAQAARPRLEVSTRPPRRDWGKLLAGLGLPVLIIALAGYVDARTAALKRQVEAADQEQQRVKDKASAHAEAADKWARALVAHIECVERQQRAIDVRGTGHDPTSLPRGGTDFAEQNRPPARQLVPWEKPTWFTTEQCPALPAAPVATP